MFGLFANSFPTYTVCKHIKSPGVWEASRVLGSYSKVHFVDSYLYLSIGIAVSMVAEATAV